MKSHKAYLCYNEIKHKCKYFLKEMMQIPILGWITLLKVIWKQVYPVEWLKTAPGKLLFNSIGGQNEFFGIYNNGLWLNEN